VCVCVCVCVLPTSGHPPRLPFSVESARETDDEQNPEHAVQSPQKNLKTLRPARVIQSQNACFMLQDAAFNQTPSPTIADKKSVQQAHVIRLTAIPRCFLFLFVSVDLAPP
jgi:hypothetical protein